MLVTGLRQQVGDLVGFRILVLRRALRDELVFPYWVKRR